MKVVMVTQFFYPHVGGVERHVCEVSKALAGGGDELHVITWKYRSNLSEVEKREGITIHRILHSDWHRGTLRRVKGWIGMGKLLTLWKGADVIHFHDYSPLIEWYLPFYAVRRKFYITFHGYEGYPIPRLSVAMRRLAHRLSQGSICVGGFIPKYYGTPCPLITYGGVDVKPPESAPEKEGAVFLGSLRRDMGITGYIAALAILRETYGIQLPLRVVGDGPLKENLIALAKEKKVELHMLGVQSDPHPFLSGAKLALVDSYLAILEAMALKIPVFSFYDNPVKKDYLYSFPGKNEILGIHDEPEKLAADIAAYLENPANYEKRVARGYAFAADQTWSRVGDLYRKLYAG
jgi:glycosyltransferase involved in cell wall biosynthesis